MLKFLTCALLLVSVNAFADRAVETRDLEGTCWGTQRYGVYKDKWASFIFRENGTGEMRAIRQNRGESGRVYGKSALDWSVKDGTLTYTFQEPSSGYTPLSGSGISRTAEISNDGNTLSVSRVQGSPFYRRSCEGLL